MNKEQQFKYFMGLMTTVFLLIISGVWVTSWYLSVKLILSGIGVAIFGGITGVIFEETNKGER